MKIKFTIKQGVETEKDGMFKTKEVEMYTLMAYFNPAETETKIFKQHPLFRNVLFMKYNEMDKWTTGIIFKDKKAEDRIKQISVGHIFDNPSYEFRAYSVPRILELRGLVINAGQEFTDTANILKQLEGEDEIEFTPNSEEVTV